MSPLLTPEQAARREAALNEAAAIFAEWLDEHPDEPAIADTA